MPKKKRIFSAKNLAFIKKLAKDIAPVNEKWWINITTGLPIKRELDELLALVVSELAECLEGERKNLMDDKLPHRKMAEVELADALIRLLDISNGFNLDFDMLARLSKSDQTEKAAFANPSNKAVWLAQMMRCALVIGQMRPALGQPSGSPSAMYLAFSIFSLYDYADNFGYDIEGAAREKLEYNRTRADHSHEARRAPNGKKF